MLLLLFCCNFAWWLWVIHEAYCIDSFCVALSNVSISVQCYHMPYLLLHHVYILLQSSYHDVIVLLLLKLLFCCNFGWRLLRNRLSELSDSNCILLSMMSTFITCIAMPWYACWSYSYLAPKFLCCCFWQPPLFFSKSVTLRCHVVYLISFDLWCLFAWLFLPCLPCHIYFSSISFVSMFAIIILFMQCSKVCFVMLAHCARNLFCLYLFNRNSVWSVLYMSLD